MAAASKGTGAGREQGAAALPSALKLWFGILAPPLIWMVRLTGSYVLVPFACAWQLPLALHLLTLATLLAALGAGAVAWRGRRRLLRTVGEPPEIVERARFMLMFGMLSAGFFAAVIAAEGVSNFFIDPCLMPGRRLAP